MKSLKKDLVKLLVKYLPLGSMHVYFIYVPILHTCRYKCIETVVNLLYESEIPIADKTGTIGFQTSAIIPQLSLGYFYR